jgi:hypothetical protein
VDQSTTSPVRQAFSAAVLGMSPEAVKNYWLRVIVEGKRPPLSKTLDQDVIAFVAGQPGAVGYIAESTPVPPTVRVVSIQ